MAAEPRPFLVDVHTHVYTPTYLQLLRNRRDPPQVLPAKGSPGTTEDEKSGKVGRLVILPGGDEGRPVGPQYWDKAEKISFMDLHGIDASVISLANPWLDFLPLNEAAEAAESLNEELQEYCTSPSPSAPSSDFIPGLANRLQAFGVLPLVTSGSDADADAKVSAILSTIAQIKQLSAMKGVILGTRGIGRGLDDPRLAPVWEAIQAAELVVFLHPHYGITSAKGESSEFGPLENGHVLPLALGFPMETAVAVSRLILAGVLDRFPALKLLLAHSAGALPVLSSRLASCVAHDPLVRDRLQNDVRWYLGRFYFDAVAYGPEELAFVERCITRAEGYEGTDDSLAFTERVNLRSERAQDALERLTPQDAFPGTRRMLFGTDHPFFPSESGERWRSVDDNLAAIRLTHGWSDADRAAVLGQNALDLFGFQDAI